MYCRGILYDNERRNKRTGGCKNNEEYKKKNVK